jgi:hypothetical protein
MRILAKQAPSIFLLGLLVMLGFAATSVSCGDDDNNGKPDADAGTGTGTSDGPVCKRPPLSLCEPPGSNPICPDTWFCPGCTCTGALQAAACDPLTQDCRRFCTGCYPDSYITCADSSAPPAVLGRCGYCFANDAGTYPKDCDRLDAILDAGGTPTPDSSVDGASGD